MESALKTLNLFEMLNPKPPYECKGIRRNPDLIKLSKEEPPLFQEDYDEYVMNSGQRVYTREITTSAADWEKDDDYTETQIISLEEWLQLPKQSTGVLAAFHKEIDRCVWAARKNGINHYHPWHEPVYYLDEMMTKIDVPQLEIRE